MCAAKGNMYAVIKEILRIRAGLDLGGVREPLFNLTAEDLLLARKAAEMIDAAMARHLR